MCGIIGYVKTSHPTSKTTKVLKAVHKELENRGMDASGYAYKTKKRTFSLKHYITATKLYNNTSRSLFDHARLFIGHTRFATSGTRWNNINNHPHYTTDLRYLLVHNGIICDNVEELKDTIKSECDSELLLRIFEHYGIKKGIKEISDFYYSSYALLLLDSKNENLYLYRNDSPAVYIDLTLSIGGYLIASTKEVIIEGLLKAGIFISNIQQKIINTKEGVLYKFKPYEKKIVTTNYPCYQNNIYYSQKNGYYEDSKYEEQYLSGHRKKHNSYYYPHENTDTYLNNNEIKE